MTGVEGRARERLDTSALTRRPSRDAVRAYRRHVLLTDPRSVVTRWQRIASIRIFVFMPPVIIMMPWMYVQFVEMFVPAVVGPAARYTDPGSRALVVLVFAVFGLLIAGLVVHLSRFVRRELSVRNRWRRRARLDAFARRNGGVYVPAGDIPGFQDGVIPRGSVADVRDVIEFVGFDAGTVRVTRGTNSFLRIGDEWGFIRVRLERQVPHLVLRSVTSRRRHGRRRSRIALAESQRLSLEGDFDRTFTLYAPDGYGRDALYVLTPDLMALLVDELPECDVDLVDDSILISTPRPFDLGDPATAERVAALAERVGAAAIRRTARYSDERDDAIPRLFVGSKGRRLRSRPF